MGQIYPDNPVLFAQRIRASYKKFLKYHSEYPKSDPRNKSTVKEVVDIAERVVKLSDKEIIRTYHGDERNNAILRGIDMPPMGVLVIMFYLPIKHWLPDGEVSPPVPEAQNLTNYVV